MAQAPAVLINNKFVKIPCPKLSSMFPKTEENYIKTFSLYLDNLISSLYFSNWTAIRKLVHHGQRAFPSSLLHSSMYFFRLSPTLSLCRYNVDHLKTSGRIDTPYKSCSIYKTLKSPSETSYALNKPVPILFYVSS